VVCVCLVLGVYWTENMFGSRYNYLKVCTDSKIKQQSMQKISR
jgi:hypothetical protein